MDNQVREGDAVKTVIAIRRKTEDGDRRDTYFYGEEREPLEISAIYWAVRQGGWEEPENAALDTIEKMQENLTHLETNDVVAEGYEIAQIIILDYDREQITLVPAYRNKPINARYIDMADWVELMENHLEYTLGNTNIYEAMEHLRHHASESAC